MIIYPLPPQTAAPVTSGSDATLLHKFSYQYEAPVSMLVETLNQRMHTVKGQPGFSYDDLCRILTKLHQDELFVPPLCIT